ncbi:MAG: RDD family protein, partial [Burkholderiaceae bacterium]
MLYEAMLLFGVLFISAWLFSTLLQQRNALYLRHALQYWLFLVVGVYFVWFWTHSGQTLAMKTWRIRLVTKNGEPVKIG